MNERKLSALTAIDQVSGEVCALSDAIWDVPETAFLETTSTKLQCETLKKLGFEVEENLAGIPTAFSGRWGSGKPVIGILGGLALMISAIFQGKAAAGSCVAFAESNQGFANYLMVLGIIETCAIFALIFSLMVMP